MSIGSWTTISGHLQGDISYRLRKTLVAPTHIDFELTAFGEKWQKFDVAFEYRKDNRELWQTDASLTRATSEYLRGNRLLGLTASKDGEVHSIRWQYADNDFQFSDSLQIRIRFLPRIRIFSCFCFHFII